MRKVLIFKLQVCLAVEPFLQMKYSPDAKVYKTFKESSAGLKESQESPK